MSRLKPAQIAVLIVVAIAAAGFSFYFTYLAPKGREATPEERAKAMKMMENFSAGQPGKGKK